MYISQIACIPSSISKIQDIKLLDPLFPHVYIVLLHTPEIKSTLPTLPPPIKNPHIYINL